MHTTQCRSCGATIAWAETPDGKRMPINVPGRKGFILTEEEGVPEKLLTGPLVTFHESHFATCPNAAQHRRA